jgi:sulfur relay (sulfurtransferase) DsrC/TusE family protein
MELWYVKMSHLLPIASQLLFFKNPLQLVKFMKRFFQELDSCVTVRLVACQQQKVNARSDGFKMLWMVEM